ncbi:MAG: penicillin-binding protein 2 [Bacteroidia bacterium]|nr:penicillin-binding protein 2 [Bacteroidia bacterium]MDW8235602.1 penicillin-binding protein 2 [Bacteroidia bacterium]
MNKTLLRFYAVAIGVGVLFLVLAIRLVYLQLKYSGVSPYQAYEQRPYLKKVVGDRGSIVARDRTILATSMPFFRVAVDPQAWRAEEVRDSLWLLAQQISRLFPEYHPQPRPLYQHLLERYRAKDRHVYLFPYRVLLTFREQKLLAELPLLQPRHDRKALIIEKISHKRSYPYGTLARITLGYLVNDSVAWRGLESSFHEKLRGEERWALVQRLPGGMEVPLEEPSEFEPQPGADLFTTLDPHLQDILSSALQEAVEKHQAVGGTALLMEVNSGEILAVANYGEQFNDAVHTLWEPGSTFKVATAAILLESAKVSLSQSIFVPATLKVADRTLTDGHPGGQMTLEEALAYSSNVAFAGLCHKAFGGQPQHFYAYLQKMQLLQKTGVSLYGEPFPTCITPKSPYFNPTTLPWMAIGYNIRLTPLQLLCFYNAIANDGVWVPPRLVKEIVYPDGRREPLELPSPVRIMRSSTAAALRRMLQSVVEKGTARTIYTSLYSIAGKTGTAKKVEKGMYVNRYRASFVGFFPADKPLYSAIFIIDDPKAGGIYGGEVAAPAFRKVADAIMFRRLRVEPRWEEAETQRILPAVPILPQQKAISLYNALSISTPDRPNTPWVRTQPTGYFVGFHPYLPSLPEGVRGMTLRQALFLLESRGYKVYWHGQGAFVTSVEMRSDREILLRLGHEKSH